VHGSLLWRRGRGPGAAGPTRRPRSALDRRQEGPAPASFATPNPVRAPSNR